MLTFAELASTPSVEEYSRNLSRVIVDLELVKLVSNVFSVVIHYIVLKESLVFGIQDCLFVVIWVIAVKRTRKRCTLDDRPEEFENLFLQLFDGHVLAAYHDARLGKGHLCTEEHIARPLLCDHELDRHEFRRFLAMHFTLKGYDLETALEPANFKVVPRHHLNLLILDYADYWRCYIVNCYVFSFLISLVKDSLPNFLLDLTHSCPFSRG